MKLILTLIVVLATGACMQTLNSSALDAKTFRDLGGSADFQAVREIFSTSCVPCHAYQGNTEAEFVALGLVVNGNPENSKIYYRLVDSAGINGPKDMPQGRSISVGEVERIRAWIQAL